MTQGRWLVCFLSIGYCATGCGEGPPPRYPLPANALAGPSVKASVGEAVEISMRPITAQTLSRYASLAVPLRWREPLAVSPPVAGRSPPPGVLHDRLASVVPLPAMWMVVENHGAAPVHFGCSALTLTTRDGKSWPVVLDRAEVERLAVERLVADERSLLLSPELLHRTASDPLAPHPLTTLREGTARAPIFDPSLEVAPGAMWQGAVVFDISAEDVASIEQAVDGAQLDLKLACAQLGETPLLPATFSFQLRPARDGGGACIAELPGSVYPRGQARWATISLIDGKRVANTDIDDALVAQAASRDAGRKAMALRGVGFAAIAAGILGTVVTSAALGTTGHSDEAPAGLAMLGLSIGGGVMTYFGYRKHTEAVRRYNLQSVSTGLCPRPN